MRKVFETTRVPGFRPRIVGRSLRLMSVRRNIVITVARDRSVLKRSDCSNFARCETPACSAFRRDSSTMSGLYSMPRARAPRLAAAMTVRPSPEPRSITKSLGVTFAMSSIFCTSSSGVGTQTTSLPCWPTSGVNVAWAYTPADTARTANATDHRRAKRHAVMLLSSSGERAEGALGRGRSPQEPVCYSTCGKRSSRLRRRGTRREDTSGGGRCPRPGSRNAICSPRRYHRSSTPPWSRAAPA